MSIRDMYRNIKHNIKNRYISKTHIISIDAVNRGKWYDRDYILIHGIFQVLVDFIEKELVLEYIAGLKFKFEYDADIIKHDIVEYKKSLEPGELMFFEASSYERKHNKFIRAALIQDVLHWNMKHSPANSTAWKELKDIYNWYKFDRPARKDPRDMLPAPKIKFVDQKSTTTQAGTLATEDNSTLVDTALNPVFNSTNRLIGYTLKDFTPEYKQYLENTFKIEEQYEKEDTDKAAKLVQLRYLLWT